MAQKDQIKSELIFIGYLCSITIHNKLIDREKIMENKTLVQRIKSELFPNDEQKNKNDKKAFPPAAYSHLSRSTGVIIAYGTGVGIVTQTAVIAASVPAGLLAGTSLLGMAIVLPFWLYFSKGLRELMSQQSSWIRMPVMFAFHTSMAVLFGFIGLAIMAACTSALVNPFVLPCLIAVTIASAIVLSASIAVACRTRYITHKDGPISKNLPKHIFNSIVDLSSDKRPFGYVKGKLCKDGLVVVPFGKDEPTINHNNQEVHSIGKSISSLFSKKNVVRTEEESNLRQHMDLSTSQM